MAGKGTQGPNSRDHAIPKHAQVRRVGFGVLLEKHGQKSPEVNENPLLSTTGAANLGSTQTPHLTWPAAIPPPGDELL